MLIKQMIEGGRKFLCQDWNTKKIKICDTKKLNNDNVIIRKKSIKRSTKSKKRTSKSKKRSTTRKSLQKYRNRNK